MFRIAHTAAALTAFAIGTALPAQTTRDQPTFPFGPCHRASITPIISPNPAATFQDPVKGQAVSWEALHTFNPAAVVLKDKVYLLYRAEDNTGPMQIGMHTSRLGLAESDDGIHFTPRLTPVFLPAHDSQQSREWPGGVEDPRLVESPDGTYVLTYTQWNRKTYTVGIATSPDLIHWVKHGPAFDQTARGKYRHFEYKSAGIVTRLVGDRLIAAKIHGKYWMYWGEIQVRLATSPDLIHWTPVEDAQGKPQVLLTGRPALFDSGFPEVGPPPLLTSQGIIVLYNGKNADSRTAGDQSTPTLSPGAYSGGQALFSAIDPAKLLDRPTQPYLHPELPFERTGQYKAGTIFTEGLVHFHRRWILYYGAADSFVGAASCRA